MIHHRIPIHTYCGQCIGDNYINISWSQPIVKWPVFSLSMARVMTRHRQPSQQRLCQLEAFPSTILTLGAGGHFDSHFWTQSGAPSPYLAFRAPPRFQAIYGVESVPRFQPIFGTQSAPPPAFKLYMVLKACPPCFQPIFGTQSAPPLSSSIWC